MKIWYSGAPPSYVGLQPHLPQAEEKLGVMFTDLANSSKIPSKIPSNSIRYPLNLVKTTMKAACFMVTFHHLLTKPCHCCFMKNHPLRGFTKTPASGSRWAQILPQGELNIGDFMGSICGFYEEKWVRWSRKSGDLYRFMVFMAKCSIWPSWKLWIETATCGISDDWNLKKLGFFTSINVFKIVCKK